MMNNQYLFALDKLNRLTIEIAEFHEMSDKVGGIVIDGMGHVVSTFNFELMGYDKASTYESKIVFLRMHGLNDFVPFFQLQEEIVYNIQNKGKRTDFIGKKLKEINEKILEIRHFQKLFGTKR